MDGELPQTMGYEAAGIVDQLGGGVADVGEGTTSTRRLS
jgi:Zn-dependent alcohol dehydrogenase